MFTTVTKMGVAAAAAAALLVPEAAAAQAYTYQGYTQNYGTGAYSQPYGYSNGQGSYYNGQGSYYGGQDGYYSRYGGPTPGYYDPCERRRDNQVAGGVVGATLGAVAGSQLAARGRRTEGSILGGVLGAAIGASAGGGSRSSRSYGSPDCDSRYRPSGYDYRYDSYGGDDRYRDDPRYDSGGYDRGYDDRYRSDYDSQSSYGYGGDDCRMAESQVRLPDGRYDTRYVRACRDSSGRYRVVD